MTDDVRTWVDDGLGRVELNRPRALNALTTDMVDAVHARLREWAGDDRVRRVLLTGAGEKGLCAGGDIRAARAGTLDGSHAGAEFVEHEYDLDEAIAGYPKPVAAWMDGIVMGGGLGLSGHAARRLVTPRSRIAMPETIIGLYPDVGMLWRLAQAPGRFGVHLALTGLTVTGADAVALGLADELVEAVDVATVEDAVRRDVALPPARTGSALPDPAWTEAVYAADDLPAVLERLRTDPEGAETLATLESRCPFSLCVTWEALRRVRRMGSLAEVFALDRRLAPRMIARADFVEGVRAQVIDKDFAPRWHHPDIAAVDPAEVAAVFA